MVAYSTRSDRLANRHRTMIARMPFCAVTLLATTALAAGAETEAPQPGQANPVLVPGATWHFEAFVVDAPDGEDWASFSKTANGAELGKKFEDGRTAAAVVESTEFDQSVLRADDLLRLARRLHAAPPEPAAMKLATYTQEATTPKGVLCARSSARFEDRRPQYSAPGTLVVGALSCIRPDKPEMLVSLRFAERFAGIDAAPVLSEQAERFLSSLRFIAPGGAMISQARGAIASKRPQDALSLLQPAAEQGDLAALMFLGNLYLYGTGVDKDEQAARRYFEEAARSGHRDALFNLGAMYDKAIGVPRDTNQAMQWFTRAADQRDPLAQLNLGIFYLRGDGVPKDQAMAEQWLLRAAGNGSTRAQGMLTLLKDRAGGETK
jgi:TPR repeat protein